MRRISILLIFFISVTATSGQGFDKVYEKKVNRSLLSMIEGDEAEYYLSRTGDYLVINTPDWYSLISGTDGSELASGDHMKKSGSVGIASALLGQGAGGALIDGEALKESSGFFAFEKQNTVVFLDWTLDENRLTAFDTKTGEQLWSSTEYRFTPGSDKQVTSVLASIAVSSAVSNAVPTSGMSASGVYYSVDMDYFKGAHGSDNAGAFITPLEGTGSFLLKAGDVHHCIDIRTGEQRWKYDDYDVNIAEHHMMPDENLVALVNFNPSYFAKSDNYVIFLDTETGEEKYRIEHLNNYVENRTHILGDRLILDYYGLEIFDIKNEERLVLSIDEKVVKANNTVSSLFGSDDGQKSKTSMVMPSAIGEEVVYTATSKMGRRVYPASAGSRNVKLHAYNIKTGEKMWSSKELDKGSHPVELAGGQVIMKRQKGLNKHIFFGVDTQSGQVMGATDKIKQYLMRNDAGYVLMDNSVLFSGKRGLYLYDLSTWKELDEIDVKKAGIGKLQAMDVTDDGLFMIGDKGIAFYDEKGDFTGNVAIKRIEGSVWSDEVIIVFTKKEAEAVDLQQQKKAGLLEKKDTMVFSDNLKHWLLEDNDFVEKFTWVRE